MRRLTGAANEVIFHTATMVIVAAGEDGVDLLNRRRRE